MMTVLTPEPMSHRCPDDTYRTPLLNKSFYIEDDVMVLQGYDQAYTFQTDVLNVNSVADIKEVLEGISVANYAIVRGTKIDGFPNYTRRLLKDCPKNGDKKTFTDDKLVRTVNYHIHTTSNSSIVALCCKTLREQRSRAEPAPVKRFGIESTMGL